MPKVWYATEESADWFLEVTSLRSTQAWAKEAIPKPGSAEFLNLPEGIKQLLRLDSPDLLITIERNGRDEPVVSIETTMATPQSQHAKQRVARIVAAAESGVAALYIIPGRKNKYRLGGDLHFAFDRVAALNKVPVLVYEWPDSDGTLIVDRDFPSEPDRNSPSIVNAIRTVDTVIEYALAGRSDVLSHIWIAKEMLTQRTRGEASRIAVSNYDTLSLIDTSDLKAYLLSNTEMSETWLEKTFDGLPHRIFRRPKTLIFRPEGRLLDHAGDPYVGMLAFFDYAFCRTGPHVEDRNMNLIHMPSRDDVARISDEFAPAGYHAYWKDKCPLGIAGKPSKVKEQFSISHHLQYGCVFAKQKPLRILGFFSDMIVFQDSVLPF